MANKLENGWALDGISASDDDGITDFSNEDNQSSWSVVVLRVLPNEQDCLHDWCKEFYYFGEVSACADQIME